MRTRTLLPLLPILAAASLLACEKDPAGPGKLPETLPFTFTRVDLDDPPTLAERDAFTRKLTGFLKDVDYFRWLTWISHGLHRSYDPTMPDYILWWQDTRALKSGDTVTFQHRGGADNIMIRTPKVLTQAAAGFMASGDPTMRELVIGYCKGIVALFQGMLWGNETDPTESIMARAIFTHNHAYETADGRKVAVDYDPAKAESYDWNAHTVPNPANPYFGDIWVRNMRSKDDVPYLFRVVPVLQRVAQDATDLEVQEAAAAAVEHLQAFAKDIVDSGYRIRSREDGETFTPEEDLASFVKFDELLKDAECDPKLTAGLIAYGDPLGIDCGPGIQADYETVATSGHYYNYAIIHYFHLSALVNALVTRHDDVARALLDGLVTRVDNLMDNDLRRSQHREWDADLAAYLFASGASGLPLTAREARLIQTKYSAAVDHYVTWDHWDLWDVSVPDGDYDFLPPEDTADATPVRHILPEELAYPLEYCASAWRNPAGVDPVDCELVLDPSAW